MRRFSFAIFLSLWLTGGAAIAQSDEMARSFKRVPADEVATLRAVVAAPVPTGVSGSVLMDHFRVKRNAAERLGDESLRFFVMEQWSVSMPTDLEAKQELALLMVLAGRYDEALVLQQFTLNATKNDLDREWRRIHLARTFRLAGRAEEAKRFRDQVIKSLPSLRAAFSGPKNQAFISRIEGIASKEETYFWMAAGKYREQIAAAEHAVMANRTALKLYKQLPLDADTKLGLSVFSNDLAGALSELIVALRQTREYSRAEEVLKDYLRLSQEEELPPDVLGLIYRSAGILRFDQREFYQAEQYFRRGDDVYAKLGYAATHPFRLNSMDWILGALIGQKQWQRALSELNKLDQLARGDEALQRQVKKPYARGQIYIGSGIRLAEAEPLISESTKGFNKTFPPGHMLIAQAIGLRAVALWRTGDNKSRMQALPLLKQAVNDYMLPDNIDMAGVGLRPDVREMVFATYLEALFSLPGEKPMDAMGPADWVRGGGVQATLMDAAVRSAVGDPRLADLVRQDQDARNETEALRKYLSESDGSSRSPLPAVSAKMRSRIAELDDLRRECLNFCV